MIIKSATNTKVTVGNTSTAVLSANTGRKGAILVNASDEAIYLSLSGTAVQGEGIYLSAAGGKHEINVNVPYVGAIKAICASGNKVLTVCELY